MMPPCKAMPFEIAPIACSRTPKCMLRPLGSSGEKEPLPATSVLFDSARSAEPPTKFGTAGVILCKQSPDTARVAIGSV